MATNQPARGIAAESMSEFVRRRNREQAARALDRASGHFAFGSSIRSGQAPDLSTPSTVAAYGIRSSAGRQANASSPADDVVTPSIAPLTLSGEHDAVGHPGFAESLIPVWSSGRETIADFQDGDYLGAALNGGLAASDLFLAAAIEKAVAKAGLYAIKGAIGETAASQGWKSVRKKMGKLGMLEPNQHGHHWFIPQKADAPNWIKNHNLNIKAMPSAEIHGRLTGPYKGKPQFGPLGQYWHGTPHWSKVATASAAGRPAAAVQARRKAK